MQCSRRRRRVFLGGKLMGDCGCMVALTPGKEVQGKVICASKGAGF